jgi:fatty acid desaturase
MHPERKDLNMDATHTTADKDLSRDSGEDSVRRTVHEESAVHFFAREAKIVLRWAVLIFGLATVMSMIAFFPLAIVPAIALLASFVLLMIAHRIELRSAQPGDPHDETAEDLERIKREEATATVDPEAIKQERIDEAVERTWHRTAAGIIVGVAVIALAIAAIIFGPELLILGGFILFAYMLLVAAPVWLGWLNDEAEGEAERMEEPAPTTRDQPR